MRIRHLQLVVPFATPTAAMESRGRTDTGKAHSPTVGDFCRMWTGLEDGAFRKRESDTISGTGEASVGSHV